MVVARAEDSLFSNSNSYIARSRDAATNEKVCEVISNTYPNVIILGRHHGFFNQNEEGKFIEEIGSLRPDILIVALGAPYAERWIHKHKSRLNTKIAIASEGA